jgi:response regulator RpfG family c-di-GMP phosphodiesterase
MKRTILYIDDEVANLRTFSSDFRRDYIISTASSGREALKLMETEIPDVLITDQSMPEMSGVEMLRLLFERNPQGKKPSRIMLSGFAEAKDVQYAKEKYGLLKFVSKPWKHQELKETIESVIQP